MNPKTAHHPDTPDQPRIDSRPLEAGSALACEFMALARLNADRKAELEIVRGPGRGEFILRHIVGGALADVPNGASLEIRCDSCGRWSSWVGVKPVDARQWSKWVCKDCVGTENCEVVQ